jgi:hypothetical protein
MTQTSRHETESFMSPPASENAEAEQDVGCGAVPPLAMAQKPTNELHGGKFV